MLTNYFNVSTSTFLDFMEAVQKLSKAGHVFEFPRDGGNSVLWSRQYKVREWDTSTSTYTTGYGTSEKEFNNLIDDVIKEAKELENAKTES